ncbi:MAG: hydrogenase maturation protease [Planctomycetota bacterium]
MTTDDEARRPVLVLGLGNLLLEDDGVGIELLARTAAACADARVEFVDGGTQGIALGATLAGRAAVLVLDAVNLGAAPGTLHHLRDPLRAAPPRGDSAHGANAGELLATAALIGDLPGRVEILGLEPASLRTGIGLSPAVAAGLAPATDAALRAIDAMVAAVAGAAPCR